MAKMRRLSTSVTWTNSSSVGSSDALTIHAMKLNNLGGIILRALSRFKSDAVGGHGNVLVETLAISCLISKTVANRSLNVLSIGTCIDSFLFPSGTGADLCGGCSFCEILSAVSSVSVLSVSEPIVHSCRRVESSINLSVDKLST